VSLGAVEERSSRIRDGESSNSDTVVTRYVRMIKYHAFGHTKAPFGPSSGKRDVHSARKCVGKVVQHESSLVRKHAGSFRPEPERHKVFVLRRREVDDAVHSTSNARYAAVLEILQQKLRRVPGCCGLPRRKVPFLTEGGLEEAVPTWTVLRGMRHGTKRNQWFIFVQGQR
jgi:hypothetical protein